MDSIDLSVVWSVSAILLGFQTVAFSWRIAREIYMESRGESIWLTAADAVIAVSMLILIFGVFVLPIVAPVKLDTVVHLLGLSLIRFAGYPFVLAGHYDLYRRVERPDGRPRFTSQEGVVLAVWEVIILGYLLWWWL
jgi:hypothetical protein